MKRFAHILLAGFLLLLTLSVSACDGHFTIHFVSNGGTPIETVQSERLNQPVYIEIEPIPIRDGYEFAGWYKDKNLGGERIVFPYESKSSDGYTVTFYAKWVKI